VGPVYVFSETAPGPAGEFSIQPNPFSNFVNLSFTLAYPGTVTLSLYNLEGRLVWQPIHQWNPPGTYEVRLDPWALEEGLYIGILTAGEAVLTGRLVKMK
jgi:hypothetical protein